MQNLTENSVFLLRIMLSEPEFMRELIDGKDESYYSRIDINTETGSIVLGKTRFNWWNRLIGDTKEISLETFAFKAIAFLGAKGKQEGHEEKITSGLLEDITDSLHRQGRSNDIIDRLFLVGYLCVKTTWSCSPMGVLGAQGEHYENRDLNVNIQGRTYHKTFKVKNGDVKLDIEIGPTGARIY